MKIRTWMPFLALLIGTAVPSFGEACYDELTLRMNDAAYEREWCIYEAMFDWGSSALECTDYPLFSDERYWCEFWLYVNLTTDIEECFGTYDYAVNYYLELYDACLGD
jgi:hypothetical protein